MDIPSYVSINTLNTRPDFPCWWRSCAPMWRSGVCSPWIVVWRLRPTKRVNSRQPRLLCEGCRLRNFDSAALKRSPSIVGWLIKCWDVRCTVVLSRWSSRVGSWMVVSFRYKASRMFRLCPCYCTVPTFITSVRWQAARWHYRLNRKRVNDVGLSIRSLLKR